MQMTNWNDLRNDEDAFIIFVTQEWLGWDDPDPSNIQVKHSIMCSKND